LNSSQVIYLVAVGIYFVFFLLFARFFFWKRYADNHYWRRRPSLSQDSIAALAHKQGTQVPFISVFVPARSEADVIAKTFDHMVSLDYPKDKYEVVIVTDEKETMAREKKRPAVAEHAAEILSRPRTSGKTVGPEATRVIISVLTHFALADQRRLPGPYVELLDSAGLTELPREGQEAILREVAELLYGGKGRTDLGRLYRILRRNVAELSDTDVRRVYPYYLALAIPVVAALCRMRGDGNGRIVQVMIARTAHAHHKVTRKILTSMTAMVSARVLTGLETAKRRGQLASLLLRHYDLCYPTTQDIVEARQRRYQQAGNVPAIKHVVVPYDFDGIMFGQCTGHPVPSTKGRALNYALPLVDKRATMCGFYDAESRPDRLVLLYVAWRRLHSGAELKILQGPVFQVRNFYDMSPFCKIAALYQAIAHDWYMPSLFRRLPFVGGTNLFVDRLMLERMGGYDKTSLTEDLELGARAYLQSGAWPEYLPYSSSEQTPPTVRGFFRQRLRWGTGHLQVMDKIREDKRYPADRKRVILKELFIKGQVEWTIYQAATFVPPVVLILWWTGHVDPNILPEFVRWILNALSLMYITFTIYAYYRYSPYLDMTSRPISTLGRWGVISQLFVLPLAAFLFPVPYSSALVLKGLNMQPKNWVKTPRTRE
jgi:cellulose synthase/poly-beta-1,6-N-acetylglucosamine synthase-like glycosyltransferase